MSRPLCFWNSPLMIQRMTDEEQAALLALVRPSIAEDKFLRAPPLAPL